MFYWFFTASLHCVAFLSALLIKLLTWRRYKFDIGHKCLKEYKYNSENVKTVPNTESHKKRLGWGSYIPLMQNEVKDTCAQTTGFQQKSRNKQQVKEVICLKNSYPAVPATQHGRTNIKPKYFRKNLVKRP